MTIPKMSTLFRILPPLLLATTLGATPGCDSESDRKPGNAPEAPREQRVLHDAGSVDVKEEVPGFTHGVRGTPGMTVDPPPADAAPTGVAPGTGAAPPPPGTAGGGKGTAAPTRR